MIPPCAVTSVSRVPQVQAQKSTPGAKWPNANIYLNRPNREIKIKCLLNEGEPKTVSGSVGPGANASSIGPQAISASIGPKANSHSVGPKATSKSDGPRADLYFVKFRVASKSVGAKAKSEVGERMAFHEHLKPPLGEVDPSDPSPKAEPNPGANVQAPNQGWAMAKGTSKAGVPRPYTHELCFISEPSIARESIIASEPLIAHAPCFSTHSFYSCLPDHCSDSELSSEISSSQGSPLSNFGSEISSESSTGSSIDLGNRRKAQPRRKSLVEKRSFSAPNVVRIRKVLASPLGEGSQRKAIKPLALDLFSWKGSVRRCLESRGFSVISVDIDARFSPDFCKDILEWEYWRFRPGTFTVIAASPPCAEYSRAKTLGWRNLEYADRLV